MKRTHRILVGAALLCWAATTWADAYGDAVSLFRNAGASSALFGNCYGYAIFPTIGKGAFMVGGAHGSGRVFVHGRPVGDTSMNQLSVGFQAGGQAYSEIIFFENREAFERFSRGDFAFGADVGAVALTAAAGTSLGTEGANAHASADSRDAVTAGRYYKGLAVFTIVKGGAMYQAAVAGQKFSYTPSG